MRGKFAPSAGPMEVSSLPAGIIPISLPLSYQPWHINVYLFPGRSPALVDTGPPGQDAWMVLEKALEHEGIKPGEIKNIFLTHGHHDHSGAAVYFGKNSGTPVWVNDREMPRLTGRQSEFFSGHLADMFRRLGAPREIREKYVPAIQKRAGFYQYQQISGPRMLTEGHRLPVEDFNLVPIFTPGHSLGSVCFFESNLKLLFTGDTLLPGQPARPTVSIDFSGRPWFGGVLDLERSLERLAELGPAQVMPGHGPPAELSGLVARTRTRLAKRQELLLKELKPGCTPFDLISKRVKRTDGTLLMSDLYQTRATLEALLAGRRVSLDVREGVEYFSPA